MLPDMPATAPKREVARAARSFSATDPVWWMTCVVAWILADIVRHFVPEQDRVMRHAAHLPLMLVLTIVPYWRWWLRAPWPLTLAMAVSCAGTVLAFGWLTGW